MKRFPLRSFEGERSAVPLNHVDDELRMFPVFVLRLAHVKGTFTDVTQIFVAGGNGDFTRQIAVGSTVVAAPAGLMKHQLVAVFLRNLHDGRPF